MPETTTSYELVLGFFLVLAALVAAALLLRPIYMPLVHLVQRTGQFLDDWFGEPDRPGQAHRPGVMERLGQLEKNSGSTIRDKVDKAESSLAQLQHDVTNIRAGMTLLATIEGTVEQLKGYAERNKGLAEAAHSAAQVAADKAEQGRAVAERIEVQRRQDVARLEDSVTNMRGDIAQDQANIVAGAFELLAERTATRTDGPILLDPADLRGLPVPPHAHELPTRHDPTLTGGPVEPEG